MDRREGEKTKSINLSMFPAHWKTHLTCQRPKKKLYYLGKVSVNMFVKCLREERKPFKNESGNIALILNPPTTQFEAPPPEKIAGRVNSVQSRFALRSVIATRFF